ncbi:alpha/beta fold hydrolase [Pseudorhodobacter sp. W20_MBD10_FR17]|uniref:alpha/beta fold hydrolase n=1 Tax=Pseudorhodobacter sp. W20_MBD10_FR17 TaxID=3240266 RepID=UPI003F95A173
MPHYAQCGDTRIAYYTQGPTDGPALVLAHAMGMDSRQWDPILPLLPPSLRIIRYDLRGHGNSSTPPGPYAMGALIRDAETLLDQLNIRDCVFTGSSLGGMVAQGLAVKRLDQIRALVLANTATKRGTKDTWARLITQVEARGLEQYLATDFSQSFSPAFRKTADANLWKTRLHAHPPQGLLSCAAAIAGTDFYTTTASLRLATLVIASANDAITPADMAREMASLIPGATFQLIPKSGHFPMIEQPIAFASALTAFLAAIGHCE